MSRDDAAWVCAALAEVDERIAWTGRILAGLESAAEAPDLRDRADGGQGAAP